MQEHGLHKCFTYLRERLHKHQFTEFRHKRGETVITDRREKDLHFACALHVQGNTPGTLPFQRSARWTSSNKLAFDSITENSLLPPHFTQPWRSTLPWAT